MPAWAGKWEGGRFYLDDVGRQVYFIERQRGGVGYSLKLPTHDEEKAKGLLALFDDDPVKFVKQRREKVEDRPEAVFITVDRINLYMQSIRGCVPDHKAARKKYISDWAEKGIDLLAVDKRRLREILASWDGGHRGRCEALNAFANFLVEEGDLPSWKRFVNTIDAKATRAPRVVYSIDQVNKTLKALGPGPIRDVIYLRAATGMHQTEIDQIQKAAIYTGPLPDSGTGIRVLEDKPPHEIRGVLQVKHKNGQRHRVSLNAAALEAVLRLRKGVPSRVTEWKEAKPFGIVPSNLRHTFATLMGEIGQEVHYEKGGVQRSVVARFMGHRAGSTMLADRYENMQIPPMAKLPLVDLDG
jgi:integrase